MGQSASSEPERTSYSKTVTNEELLSLFSKACRRQFKPIELLSIQKNMKAHDKDKNELISEMEFQELLHLPTNRPRLLHLLYNTVKALSNFPLMNHDISGINFDGLLNSMVLLNTDRYGKILKKEFDYLKLIFLAISIESASKFIEKFENQPDTQTISYSGTNVISWTDTDAVKTFDNIDISEIYIEAEDLLEIITFLLIITRLEPQESLDIYKSHFEKYESYEKHALSILRSMNPNISSKYISNQRVKFDQFQKTMLYITPNLLQPLSSLLEILLFEPITDPKEFENQVEKKQVKTTSKLINDEFLSQLATVLPKEVVYSKIRKLYVGSDSGFSMRSFESKVFKWNAPTILLIRGGRVNNDKTKNPRFKNFEEDFSFAKKELTTSQKNGGKELIYGVYISQPWKITNKDSFGDSQTTIFQLSPIQKIFKPSISAKNFIYFNTIGGGLGFGSRQPTLKNNIKRYNPGNVSLTIDSTLEFAVFRNLGLGGEFKSIDDEDLLEEYEDVFQIRDVEVWGCGGAKELEEQNKRWEWEQQEAQRRQGVNLKSIGEDRALLEMAGLVGQHQTGGSV
ncbi:hypothetical protein BN7_3352 [Wickerhamomyces ciferrii]|uniref:Restriction of telomere capping protein 5 n=1 Tax=Wickerhamomyces ciferrii (strain ATCC 14091 / BCRC 22168 / CBS 111 / JCM 3599 / NBRC 0793 / NRRL Y-1031 F-60-10) TaxID=1206466 RepID=K0KR75_WICCF|nr:uncharacterized protein BN7_3352 [Wickerhamomyces ciferrii]CCH43798.1 hypothetical protein BN7_3352 [Wickerhamomyces ciferrii]